ncbi:MAG: pantoate--beta-alanine ligase [Vicingaceae bacterium]
MKHFTSSNAISRQLNKLEQAGQSIGFVPTMGALHEGHMGLIERAKAENNVVVCSIFVNPLQFNRQVDLDTYPDRMKEDKAMLKSQDCDFLFSPTKEDLYQEKPALDYDFGSLGRGMEADYRPGHFEGVAAVIDRFLRVLKPSRAYFGEKDFQQLAIVKWLVEKENFDTQIVGCETIRFENGLAMSSRNYNLAEEDFKTASEIYQWMKFCQKNKGQFEPQELAAFCFEKLKQKFEPEYVTIADENNMKPLEKWSDSKRPRVFIAAYLSSVRLIDNLSLIN